jgi:hypothetical protein
VQGLIALHQELGFSMVGGEVKSHGLNHLMRGEISQDNAERDAKDVSCNDIVLVEMQGIPDSSLEEGDEHGGGKHVIEASPKSLSQACNEEKEKNGGEESTLGSDKHLLETSVSLQEKTQEQKENGPKTEEKCSDENLIRTGSEGFTTVDVESDNQVKYLEGVMTSLGLESSIPASNAPSSHIDHTSSDLKLTIEKGSTPVMQHKNVETQGVESLSPVSFQDDQNQNASLVNPGEKLAHDVTGSLGENGSEKFLEANSDVTQNESVDVQGFGSQASHALEKLSSVNASQDQENERKDTSLRSDLPTKDIENLVKTTSPEGKDILLLSHIGDETDGCNFGATSLQGPNQSALPAEHPITGTSQQALQVNDSCVTSESDYSKHANQMNLEFERNVKEDNTLVGIKVQDEGKTDTTFSSDGQQSM